MDATLAVRAEHSCGFHQAARAIIMEWVRAIYDSDYADEPELRDRILSAIESMD